MRLDGVRPMDVGLDELPGAVCVYYLEAPEPTLIDPGPSTCITALTKQLSGVGVSLADLRHVLLTHVHLDHAGAVGHLARENPRLTVHVHEEGAPHMASPERLVASTRRTFGDAHDRLWGEVLPVPENQLRGWRPGDSRPLPGMLPLPTPGHIAHHLAWEAERLGVLFAGDSLGILLAPGAPTHPATPPPSVDLLAWHDTLERVLAPVQVDAFGATHFGLHPDLHGRRVELRTALDSLALRVRSAMRGGEEAEDSDREAFAAETIERVSTARQRAEVERYFRSFSSRSDWDGMRFHLARSEAAAAWADARLDEKGAR